MSELTRETGDYPLSIGTSLALEGLLGKHPNQPKYPPGHGRINALWVNLRTLVRNLVDAIPSEQVSEFHAQDAVELAIEEVKTLMTVMDMEGRSKITVTCYQADLAEVKWKMPNAIYRVPKTEKQKTRAAMEEYVLQGLRLRMVDEAVPCMDIAHRPTTQRAVVALLTHYPHELFWRFEFDGMFLLESHTGKLKSYSQWQTKLKHLPDDTRLPFSRFTLQVFGDGNFILAQAKKTRDELLQLAQTRHWSGVTTDEKIYHDISKWGGEKLKDVYRELMTR